MSLPEMISTLIDSGFYWPWYLVTRTLAFVACGYILQSVRDWDDREILIGLGCCLILVPFTELALFGLALIVSLLYAGAFLRRLRE